MYDHVGARPGSNIENISIEKRYELLKARGELLLQYPLTYLEQDLFEAKQNNLTYAALFLERMISNFKRQIPIPMEHVNQIAVVSFAGQVVNLMRGNGATHHRLQPSSIVTARGVRRQFQHPGFSNNGKYLAIAELHFRDADVVRADALVYEVVSDPKAYGALDTAPSFDSGDLPGSPFFLRFSPDDQSLALLCTSSEPSGVVSTSLVVMEWSKYHNKDTLAGKALPPTIATRKALTLMTGSPVFFSYTTSNPKNATIVAHCQKEVEDPISKAKSIERAVWLLQRQDTGGVRDTNWVKISNSDAALKWSVPICHSAGGGDSVVVVEDGWLVTKALSRWKRGPDMALCSKKLLKVRGHVQFMLSPDHSRAVVLQEDVAAGSHSITIIDGEEALDPSSPELGNQYQVPFNKLTLAFWISPDSTKLLCMTVAGRSLEDMSNKENFRVGLNTDMQWVVFNLPLQEVREYDTFKPTPYFMKTYVPFFTQYSQMFNPWAPDSRSFFYISPSGLCHVPLVGSKHCLGEDKWVNQGATFGTWSRL